MESSNHIRSHDSSRKRSRSPYREDRSANVKRHRSRSPKHRSHHHHHHSQQTSLPFGAQPLHKHDFKTYRALFAEYLDVQKKLDIDALDEHEVKGRWKSFVGRWNRGELAEGWYDPDMKRRAEERESMRPPAKIDTLQNKLSDASPRQIVEDAGEDEDEDDGFGPSLPSTGDRRVGPVVPSLQDLQYRQELGEGDRSARLADLRYDRKQDRQAQKDRLEELAPRADPGSRERQLEKKRETTATNRAFREAKSPGAEDVGEKDLLGDDGVEGFKAKRKAQEKLKNEREIRKEEVLRARAVEREERMAEHSRKEEKTMEVLRAIAKQRFG